MAIKIRPLWQHGGIDEVGPALCDPGVCINTVQAPFSFRGWGDVEHRAPALLWVISCGSGAVDPEIPGGRSRGGVPVIAMAIVYQTGRPERRRLDSGRRPAIVPYDCTAWNGRAWTAYDPIGIMSVSH